MSLRPVLLALPLAMLAACGDKDDGEYDLETWKSPLASGFDGEGDAAKGEEIYYTEHWTDSSGYAFTCDSCHSADPADTWLTDGDELTRPAHTTWNAAYRETWKSNHAWDKADSDKLGAFGGQICIKAYFPDGGEMTAEQATHLEAWMKTNVDADPSGNPTAEPLDYAFGTWSTKDAFIASIGDGDWLYGADLGDVSSGEALAAEYCGSCHTPEGQSAPVLYTAATADLDVLVARIRRTSIGDTSHSNDRMPALPPDRLGDDDLADILAWLTQGREG